MRQLPAIDSRSWKQKRGISPPAASHACRSVYSGGTSISLPSTRSLVMPPVRLARRSAPSSIVAQPARSPSQGIVGRAVRGQIFKPLFCFLDGRPVAGWHPPHHEVRLLHLVEPLWAPAVKALMDSLPNEAFKRFDAFPDREV